LSRPTGPRGRRATGNGPALRVHCLQYCEHVPFYRLHRKTGKSTQKDASYSRSVRTRRAGAGV